MTDNRCIELVFSTRPGDFKPRRCNRPAGHGKGGEFCSSHSVDNSKIEPLTVKRRQNKVFKGGSKK